MEIQHIIQVHLIFHIVPFNSVGLLRIFSVISLSADSRCVKHCVLFGLSEMPSLERHLLNKPTFVVV